MLYLNRKLGEAVIINHAIEVRVVAISGKRVKLGFAFPPEASVLREEVVEAIKRANRAAARTAGRAARRGPHRGAGGPAGFGTARRVMQWSDRRGSA
jgi:carbon storage regulator